ncbi:SDR family oxidoreductase [bacterium]|nr:SDR family oxidoreductase [bacterium]
MNSKGPHPINVLVTGASGYIGGRLVPELLKAGCRVSVLVRNPRKLSGKPWLDRVTVFRGDALDAESLRAACRGQDVAYYLIHSMTSAGGDFEERDERAARTFSTVAGEEGLNRIIYLGGLGITGSGLSKHLRSRHETGEALRHSGVPVTELRAAIIVGSQSASFVIVRDLVKKLPVMLCPKWVQSKCEPISIRQLLGYLVGVLWEPRSVGEILEVGGGEVLTYAEMMQQCAEVMGKPLKMITVPVLTPNLSSYWLNLVTQVPYRLARPLVEGLKNDVVTHDHRIREWIKTEQLTYKQSVELALLREKERTFISSWIDATTSSANDPVPDGAEKPFVDQRSCLIDAPEETVFQVVSSIGGDNGWYHSNWLWQLRALMDWLIGGPGMRRGRPETLYEGAALDFWRVEEIDPPEKLVLRAEMLLPGVARLTFLVKRELDLCRVTLQASFWPTGVFGKVYWYGVVPLHDLVFNGLLKEIRRRSELLSCSEEKSNSFHGDI